MRPPSTTDLLVAWETGLERGPTQRGLVLLGVACPEAGEDVLAALSIGERDRRLFQLREAAFGPRMTGLVDCTTCGERLELDLATSDLLAPPPADAAERLVLRRDDWKIVLRLPDSRDLIAAAADPSRTASLLFTRAVRSASHAGMPVAAEDLPANLREEASQRLAEAEPQVDTRLALTCAACGSAWQAPFDILSFLWTELDAWAARLLNEVHALAAAYGWAERDILALSPARRRRYLQMVGT
jgi:hypothetical protein